MGLQPSSADTRSTVSLGVEPKSESMMVGLVGLVGRWSVSGWTLVGHSYIYFEKDVPLNSNVCIYSTCVKVLQGKFCVIRFNTNRNF